VKAAKGAAAVVRKPASAAAIAEPKVASVSSASSPTKTPTVPGKTAQQSASPSLKAAVKSEAKPVGKTKLSLTTPVKAAAGTVVKAPKKDVAPVVSASVAPPPPVAPRPVPSPIPMSSLKPPPPLKPGRRSSARTAAQSPPPAPMVPTHAPDAAKASYSAMTERVIAPMPQAAAKKDPKLANNWKTKSAGELTDDEIKSMPDSEYMNEKQLAFFRHKLSLLKQDIHNSAGATTEHLREDTVVVPDPADRATIEEEHALELRTRDRERKLLKKIEQSIGRIDSGDYGYCDETGEAIGVGRLIARPTANLSLEAQQRRELKQKMFGD
jgi:DnaK suppressor protein